MTLNIQIVSDIHLDHNRNFSVVPTAPFLALLGDIGDPGSSKYLYFLLEQARQFEKVFVLIGNHSCYGRTPAIASQMVSEICETDPEHLIFLNKSTYDISDTHTILGMTLWSHITERQRSSVQKYLSDGKRILDWSVEKHNAMHQDHLTWLKTQLAVVEKRGKKAIVLSHHAPTFRGTIASSNKTGPITTAFATDLEYLLKSPIVLACFGHTHFSCDQMIGSTRVVSNQVGYPGETTGYRPGFVISI